MRTRALKAMAVGVLLAAVAGCGDNATPSVVSSPGTSPAASPVASGATSSSATSPTPEAVPSPPIASPSCTSGHRDFAPDAHGGSGEPVDVTRSQVIGIRSTDRVKEGAVTADRAEVTITRNGQTIGTVVLDADGEGGWLLTTWELCGGLSLREP